MSCIEKKRFIHDKEKLFNFMCLELQHSDSDIFPGNKILRLFVEILIQVAVKWQIFVLNSLLTKPEARIRRRTNKLANHCLPSRPPLNWRSTSSVINKHSKYRYRWIETYFNAIYRDCILKCRDWTFQ